MGGGYAVSRDGVGPPYNTEYNGHMAATDPASVHKNSIIQSVINNTSRIINYI